MKRFFKYLGRTILAILGLLLLIVFLLYLPPVQDFLLRKAERYAASHYDLEVLIVKKRCKACLLLFRKVFN